MKIRNILAATTALVTAVALTGCGSSNSGQEGKSASGKSDTIVVAASPTPHAQILKFLNKEVAPKHGYKIDIKEFNDYVQPNEALKTHEVDANYFQTIPFLNNESKQRGYKFEPGESVHLEPVGIFSKKVKNVNDLKEGDKVGIIQDVTNQDRALRLLGAQGLIKLPKKQNLAVADVKNSKEFNPKGLVFQEVDGPQLVRSLADVDISVINGNYAQAGGLKQSEAIALESTENNPATNLLVWRKGEKSELVKKLEKDLHSKEVKDFIEKTWPDKSVIPAF